MNESTSAAASQPEPDWRHTTVSGDLSFLLARSNALSLAAGNALLHEYGLKVRSYPVLALACDGVKPTQRELAEILKLDPSQVVALIDGLEADGLVERQVDARDRRSKVLVPTAAGKKLFARAQQAMKQLQIDVFAVLSEEEREQFAGFLSRIAFS